MCGIAGVLDSSGPVDASVIQSMCAAMEHRGPDFRGIHLEDGLGLGAQRLAIIDIAHGDQPIRNETGDVVAVFNGEIYNHHQLRKQLIARGHRFRSAVDSEVLVHLYEDEGPDLVRRLRGMFAFAIWDRRHRRLTCARDRVGKKPLFWARRGGRFTFASSLVALLQDETIERLIEPQAIEAYLALQYVPDPLCAVRGVQKLPPACTLVLEPNGSERIERYWQLRYLPKRTGRSADELGQALRSLFDEATRLRLQSDVPLGALLSGGIDSGAVVASMAANSGMTIKTFSVGFDDEGFDETPFARLIAERFATDHHELRLRPDVVATMPRLARHYGEPFGDPSALATFQVSELVSREVTVVLTGDGGDESFAGYERYVPTPRALQAELIPRPIGKAAGGLLRPVGQGGSTMSVRRRLRRQARRASLSTGELYVDSVVIFDAESRRALLDPGFAVSRDGRPPERMLTEIWDSLDANHRTDRMMGVDIATYLPGDLLVKLDVATMAHSVEARSPFLDHELMEFAAALPPELKLDGSRRKAILKQALRGALPDEILDRRKMGFAVPVGRWLRTELSDKAAELLLDAGASTAAYLDRGEVEKLIREHQLQLVDHSMRIWVLMMLESWHREVLRS
jgi:asparagine synthase (glutamine-hydrolysing)